MWEHLKSGHPYHVLLWHYARVCIRSNRARLLMLRTDYRQYPTYPHGRIIHISLGCYCGGAWSGGRTGDV